MKKLLIITICFQFITCTSQDKESAYLFFDSNNKNTFVQNKEGIEYKENIYREHLKQNTYVDFYIFNELFRYTLNSNDSIEINENDFTKLKFNSVEEINETWKKSNLFSKRKVYDKVYVIKPSNKKDKYIRYLVEWIDYQE